MDTSMLDRIFYLDVKAGPDPTGQRVLASFSQHNVVGVSSAEDDQGKVISWGAPGVSQKIISVSELYRMLRSDGVAGTAKRLDGSFLICFFDRATESLHVITDRSGSLPFFYSVVDGNFVGSSSFKHLFDQQDGIAGPQFDPWAVAEFFYFRRVFGGRSYSKAIHYLEYGRILTYSLRGLTIESYWKISGEKLSGTHDALADELAEALRESMRFQMSDGRRYGLMLSGGLDARALLAASEVPPVCFTTTPHPNNELEVARELAEKAGATHFYLPRPEQLLNDAVDIAVFLGGGMTVFHEVQFMGYGANVRPHADVIFLGLALDIMFCGHYLPKSLVKVGGRNTWMFRLHDVPADMPGAFVESVSYRLKTSDPFRVIRSERRAEFRERLRATVEAEMDEARDLGLTGYDIWEYMHLHNLSRHYSMLMAQSVRTYSECRIPALTNRLQELCWGMRAQDKANWAVYQKAIRRISPRLMKVRNANTNIRADVPLWAQSAIKFAKSGLSKLLPFQRLRTSPAWWDRSWPEPRHSIAANPNVQHLVRSLHNSERLAALDIFDQSAIARIVSEHFSGGHDHTILLNLLVTIDRALEPMEL